MALVGIGVGATLTYVSDLDPCKRRVPKKVPDPEAEGQFIDDPKGGKEVVIDPGATAFRLAGLDVFLMARIYDDSSTLTRGASPDEVGLKTRINQTNIEAVRFGLKGWEHFTDAKGDDLPFTTNKRTLDGRDYEVVSDTCMNRLGNRLIGELAGEIKRMSEVAADEAKNSSTASSPSS